MTRNYIRFDRAFISERGGQVLYLRSLYNRMHPKEYAASFFCWSPCATSRAILERYFKHDDYSRLSEQHPGSFHQEMKKVAFQRYEQYGPVQADTGLIQLGLKGY